MRRSIAIGWDRWFRSKRGCAGRAQFHVTQAQSSAVLSGNINGSPVSQQGARVADRDLHRGNSSRYRPDGQHDHFMDGYGGDRRQFGHLAAAAGRAAGSAPANYGGRVVRSASSSQSATCGHGLHRRGARMAGGGSARTFPSTQTTLAVTNGSLDYNAGILGMGSTPLVGNSGMNGASTANGNFTDSWTEPDGFRRRST